MRTTSQYDTNGVMGSGKWYGVPNYAEYTMVSSTTRTSSRGTASPSPPPSTSSPPAMDTFVSKGITPLANAARRGTWPSKNLYQLALSQADRSWV